MLWVRGTWVGRAHALQASARVAHLADRWFLEACLLSLEPDLCEDIDVLQAVITDALKPYAPDLPAALVDTRGDVLMCISRLRDVPRFQGWIPAVVSALPPRAHDSEDLRYPPVLVLPMVLPRFCMPKEWIPVGAPVGSMACHTAQVLANEGLTMEEAVRASRALRV